ncbi:MAG: hypothetical protein Q8K62_06420 [Thiobacillus sp.]|nr:hypothetical protein [Thiobacillus sp.]
MKDKDQITFGVFFGSHGQAYAGFNFHVAYDPSLVWAFLGIAGEGPKCETGIATNFVVAYDSKLALSRGATLREL